MKKGLFVFVVLALLAVGCSDKHDEAINESNQTPSDPITKVPANTIKVNRFIVDCFQDLYLWESRNDWAKYDTTCVKYLNSQTLFDELISEKDRWSFLTDDIEGMQSEFEGVTTTFGYNLTFGLFSNTGTVFAIVRYTYPNSPASNAGLKRGDIIMEMNGSDITTSNYTDLYYASSLTINKGIIEGDMIGPDSVTISMTAVEMYEDPINTDTIIEKGSNKIGYLCYTGYQMQSERALQDLFGEFKAKGVTDVVLDLRYNGGGYSRTAQLLSSILAPASVVKGKGLCLSQVWNDSYNRYWKEQGDDMKEYFVDTLSVNMDLSRLYVLTSDGTASASEATIIGLKPYMDIVLVGDTTYGKSCGCYLMSVKDYYNSNKIYSNIFNWGTYVTVYEFTNSKGNSVEGGLVPNFYAEEDLFDLKPFGDEKDPLLGKALEQITGEKYVETKSMLLRTLPSYKILPFKFRTDGVMLETKALPTKCNQE